MKIEKGKLYLDKDSDTLFKADMTTEEYPDEASDKIAVHCRTRGDWGYVINIVDNGLEYDYTDYEDESVVFLNRGYYASVEWAKVNNYHIITIDEFKRFYPESVISNKTNYNDPINPTHYNQYAIQPLDYIEANGFDFCEGNVIKYVSRYKQKNGLEDLKKARVYLDKLINRYEK